MTRPSLSCDEVEDLLPLVADGTLDDRGDPTLFMHLADCERCQQSLATHDLIAVSLPRAARLPESRIMRPWWLRVVPTAVAASLLIGGIWLAFAASPADSGPISPTATSVSVVAGTPSVVPGSGVIEIEVEVVTLPGSTTAHPHYLVRRGEQVLLMTPQVAPVEVPSDARQASFSPSRY